MSGGRGHEGVLSFYVMTILPSALLSISHHLTCSSPVMITDPRFSGSLYVVPLYFLPICAQL